MGLEFMALGDAYVNIMGETNQLAASFARARMMTAGLVTGLGKTIVGGIGAAFLAAGGTVAYSMKSFMGAEVVSNKLAGAIALAGGSVSALLPKYEALADKMARVTKYDDEAVKSAMASALARGLSTEKMEEAIPAAVGLAARMGMDLSTAMNMVTRAGMGNTMMLQRYFPQLKNATTQTEKWAMIMKLGAAGMGISRNEINTLSGAFGQMRKAIGEVFESLGTGLFGGGQLKKFLQDAVDWVWKLKDSLDKLVKSGQFQAWIGTAMNVLKSADLGQIIWLSIKIGFMEATNWVIKFGKFLADVLTVSFQQALLVISSGKFWLGVGQTILGSLMGIGAALLKVFTTPLDYLEAGITFILEKLWQGLGKFGPGGAEFKARDYETIFKETQEKGTFRTSTGDSAKMARDLLNKGTANIAEAGKTPLISAIDELTEKFRTTMGEKGLFDTDESKAQLKALFDPLRELAVAQRDKDMAAGEKPSPTDTASKASFSIISMSDQWKKMQEGITKNKDEKEIREATKKTASWTEQTAKGVATLINKFDGGESASPLFAAGY